MSDELVLHDLVQGSPEWHAFRRTHYPASITPMLMGTSKFQDAGDAYDAIMDDVITVESFSDKIRDFGSRSEPRARAALELKIGREGIPVVGSRGKYSASLDFLSTNQSGGPLVFEVKCPFSGAKSSTWKAAEKGIIEPGYMDQMEHQYRVFLPDEIGLAVYLDDKHMILLPYTPRPDRWREIQRAWEHFQKHHIDLFTRPNPYAYQESEEWAQAASNFRIASEALDAAEARAEEARKCLIHLAGGHKSEGFGVRVNIFPKRGAVDYKAALSVVAPELDVEPFRKAPSTSTVVTIIKEQS